MNHRYVNTWPSNSMKPNHRSATHVAATRVITETALVVTAGPRGRFAAQPWAAAAAAPMQAAAGGVVHGPLRRPPGAAAAPASGVPGGGMAHVPETSRSTAATVGASTARPGVDGIRQPAEAPAPAPASVRWPRGPWPERLAEPGPTLRSDGLHQTQWQALMPQPPTPASRAGAPGPAAAGGSRQADAAAGRPGPNH